MSLQFEISQPTPTDDSISDCVNNTSPNGKFKIWARYYILTFKTHLHKFSIATHFQQLGVITCRVAHEKGTKKIPYEHSHVFVDFGKQFHATDSRVFDYDGIHPNIGPISYQKHLNRIYKYMCKEDHENDDMKDWVSGGGVQDVWEFDNLQNAVKNAPLKDVIATIAAYNLKPQTIDPPEDWEFEWQYKLHVRMTTTDQPKRQIWWYCDTKGGAGKTDFCKGMKRRYPLDTLIFTQFGGARDCATVIVNSINAGWTGKYCIIDLPRDSETKSFYEPLESIRNGMITALKYQGMTVMWKSRWILVMANFNPEFGHMSADRWVCYDMSLPYFKLRCDDVTRIIGNSAQSPIPSPVPSSMEMNDPPTPENPFGEFNPRTGKPL